MVESRWFRRAGPAVAALGGIALIATTTVGAPRGAWTPDVCAGAPRIGDHGVGELVSDRSGHRRRAPGPASGWSSGVPASAARERSTWMSESFAAGPFGGTTLVGTDDGRRSRLSLVDTTRGCAWPLVDYERRRSDRNGRVGWRHPLRVPRRPEDPRRPRRLATGARWLGRRPHASCPRSRPMPASARRGSRRSPGARTAGRSRCSPAARSRAASASSTRAATTCGSWPIRRSVTSSGSTAIAWSRTAPAVVSPARCSPWTS